MAVPISLTLNGSRVEIALDPATPLLWALRDHLNLTGTKYGCGVAACGACTVVIDGRAHRSCVTPLEAVSGRSVTTIEGLAQVGLAQVELAQVELAQEGLAQGGPGGGH